MIDYEKRRKRAKRFKERLMQRPTLSEIKFKRILEEMSIPYKFQKKIFTQNGFFIGDFYLTKSRIIIEIDGGIHNDRFEYDKKREEEILKTRKIKFVVHFPNELIENNKDFIKKEIQNLLDRKGKFYEGLVGYKSRFLSKVGKERKRQRELRRLNKIT